MGNCLVGGMGDAPNQSSVIKVATSHGGVMEFYAPVTVESITDEFPGHGIFRSHDVLFWKPLPHTELLVAGESYQLLPLIEKGNAARVGHVRSNSAPAYRMSSCDSRGRVVKRGEEEGGFWKVKVVISAEQLAEILGEECKTEELIESVRAVAKCGSSGWRGGFSDQWSLSSSRNAASSNKDSSSLFEF